MGKIRETWQPGYAAMLIDVFHFAREAEVAGFTISALEEGTRRSFGNDMDAWYEWLWAQPYRPHPDYAEFMHRLYRNLDPRFAAYFANDRAATIRLDEVRWGGVLQDGIPPLRGPKMISAAEADYLGDDNVVFGIAINDDIRAYPKRILAWHEMFTDVVGGIPLAGVYCTLCGTAILYETTYEGVEHEVGTSGFLYRSNKLMYDRATQSLWSTLWGRPVIGPLVGKGIQLRGRAIVTTTWAEWRRRHPQTLVLSLDTGHNRDYSEGAAYREYFSTDRLMFNVPKLDRRLKNKDEVLTLVLDGDEAEPLAIAAELLAEEPVHHNRIGDLEIVVLTDASGANRVYSTGGVRFSEWDQDRRVVDAAGDAWTLDEDRLIAEDGRVCHRLPAQRAFWFGWFAAYPQTRLVTSLQK